MLFGSVDFGLSNIVVSLVEFTRKYVHADHGFVWDTYGTSVTNIGTSLGNRSFLPKDDSLIRNCNSVDSNK